MGNTSDAPPISKALLDWMSALWPEKSANAATDTYASLVWQGGQRSVVRKVADEYRRQNENILGGTR